MIKIINLNKSFDGKPILKDFDLDIPKGEVFALVGKSGCGKSVLLKHILRLIHPDSGEIWIDGKNIDQLSFKELEKLKLQIGMVFQNSALFDSLNVEENVGFPLSEHSSLNKGKLREKVERALKAVNLEGILDKMPSELSGGMRKRVAFARAIIMEPPILLFDEPTTGLDPITSDVINQLMVKLKGMLHVTGILVTHDLKSAFSVADRVGMIHAGQIYKIATPREFEQSDDPIIRNFVLGKADEIVID